MKNFVVTGATGHLGNTLVQELLKVKNSTLKLLVLDGEDVSIFKDQDLTIAYGNVLDVEFLKKEINEGDIVFHLAGIIDISSSNKDLLYKVNVEGTKNIATVCMEKNVSKFVYTSSVHVIPPLKKGVSLAEPLEFDSNKIVGDYAKSKTMATGAVLELAKQGLNAIVTYPAGIIGPNDYKVSEMGSLILDICNKKIRNRVSGGYNFVDVRDVAKGVLLASEHGEVGKGYILSGHMVTVDELFKLVNEKFNRTKLVPKIAMWFVKMFARLAELHYKIRKQKPLFTSYSLYTLTSNHNFSNQKAKNKLGFTTRPTKDSLHDAIDWFVKHKPQLFTQKTLDEYHEFNS